MKRLIFICFAIFLLTVVQLQAQEIQQHKWKNRVLLIMVTVKSDAMLKEQLSALRGDESGLKERKLVIYQLTPEAQKRGLKSSGAWKPSTLYKQFKLSDEPFEAALIGLDGEVKKQKIEPFAQKELFAIIDSMPMRKAELNRQKN